MEIGQYVGSQSDVPLPDMNKTSTCDKTSACMARVLAGVAGAGIIIVGSTLTYNRAISAGLFEGMLQPLLFTVAAGVVSGVLSENRREAFADGGLLGGLLGGLILVGRHNPT